MKKNSSDTIMMAPAAFPLSTTLSFSLPTPQSRASVSSRLPSSRVFAMPELHANLGLPIEALDGPEDSTLQVGGEEEDHEPSPVIVGNDVDKFIVVGVSKNPFKKQPAFLLEDHCLKDVALHQNPVKPVQICSLPKEGFITNQKRIIVTNNFGEKLVGIFHDTGSRELVILCHGFRSSKESSTVMKLVDALTREGISVFRFDFSGNGESEGIFQYGNYRKEVGDLHAVIVACWRLNHEISAIVGHSKGGNVVLLYTSMYHDIHTVINISSRFDLERGVEDRLGKDFVQRIKKDGFIDVEDKNGRFLYRVSEESLMDRLRTDMRVVCLSIDKNCRVLTVHGSADEIVPAEDALEFAKHISNHKLHIIQGADHSFGDGGGGSNDRGDNGGSNAGGDGSFSGGGGAHGGCNGGGSHGGIGGTVEWWWQEEVMAFIVVGVSKNPFKKQPAFLLEDPCLKDVALHQNPVKPVQICSLPKEGFITNQKRIIVTNNFGEKLVGIFHDTGSRELVILCHGFRSSKESSTVMKLVDALTREGISVFRFDFSGNGESEGIFQYGNYRKEVGDLHAVIVACWRLNHEISAIVGHSKGGNVVLLYTSMYHDIHTVINISSRFDLERGVEDRLGKDFVQRIKKDGFIDVEDKNGRFLYRVSEESLMDRLRTDMRVVCLSIDKNCRVLTVHGSADEIVPAEDALEFAKHISNHKLHIIQGADHRYSMHQAELASTLLEFISSYQMDEC